MSESMSSFNAALKEFYSGNKVENLCIKNQPFYARTKRNSAYVGLDYYRVPLIIGNSSGVSTNFATAQANGLATSSTIKGFKVTRHSAYSIGYIDSILLSASKGPGAFIEANKVMLDGVVLGLARDTGIAMYKTGFSERGQISSISTTKITLTNAGDVMNFEIGNHLDLSAALGAGASAKAHGSASGLVITGLDRSAGTLSFAANVTDSTNGVPTAAPLDYIFLEGDVSTTRNKLAGLAGWLPTTAPTAGDDFFGVDRSVDTDRLAGIRFDASTGIPLYEAINTAAGLVNRAGGKPDTLYLSFSRFSELINALETKVRYDKVEEKKGVVGFNGIEFLTSTGLVSCFPDINAPDNVAYLLQQDTWELPVLGSAEKHLQEDTLSMRYAYNADKLEVRYRATVSMACNAPGFNCVLKLA